MKMGEVEAKVSSEDIFIVRKTQLRHYNRALSTEMIFSLFSYQVFIY